MYFQSVILHCHQKMQKERSISATYYLLQGKPSIQTIQDGQIYQLHKYFGIYKKLKKDRFFQLVKQLESEQLLQKQSEENFYQVTMLGKKTAEKYLLTPNFLKGYIYHHLDEVLFKRILLFVQVFTNRKMNNLKFIPIIEDRNVENWMKSYYRKWNNQTEVLLKRLYHELISILSPLDDAAASVFVDQLTGYQQVGLTMEQISIRLKTSIESVYLVHTNTLHYLLQTIQERQQQYPLLYSICFDLFQQSALTNSANKTKMMLNTGLSLHEIAKRRHLQLNTIYDHIVEIAVKNRYFSITEFVPKKIQQEIIETIRTLNSYKLKDIKENLDEHVSYFQIRLVIAKLEELMEEGRTNYLNELTN